MGAEKVTFVLDPHEALAVSSCLLYVCATLGSDDAPTPEAAIKGAKIALDGLDTSGLSPWDLNQLGGRIARQLNEAGERSKR